MGAGHGDGSDGGFVTYSNAANTVVLGVLPSLIDRRGACRGEVALAMAGGALTHGPVQRAGAVTGIAGPGGAVPGKPVGTVWLAWGTVADVRTELLQLGGDRDAVRGASVHAALQRLTEAARP